MLGRQLPGEDPQLRLVGKSRGPVVEMDCGNDSSQHSSAIASVINTGSVFGTCLFGSDGRMRTWRFECRCLLDLTARWFPGSIYLDIASDLWIQRAVQTCESLSCGGCGSRSTTRILASHDCVARRSKLCWWGLQWIGWRSRGLPVILRGQR